MGKPPRILLKDDAIPTVFAHNADKQPQKRKSSVLREEARTKRQLCEDVAIHQELINDFEFECNTKETQTEITSESFNDFLCQTKAITTVDIGVQCCIKVLDDQIYTSDVLETETESEHCQESDYVESEVSDEEVDIEITTPKPSKAAYIVYWTSLIILLKRCLYSSCLLPATITIIAFKGSQLIVRLKCKWGHNTEWKSQPNCNHYSVGNLVGAASVLFSANTYQRLARFFDLAEIQWISKTSFYAIQNRYLHGIVNRNYIEKSKAISNRIKQANSIDLSGDGRCGSPGHNA